MFDKNIVNAVRELIGNKNVKIQKSKEIFNIKYKDIIPGLISITFVLSPEDKNFYINILIRRNDGSKQICLFDSTPAIIKGLFPINSDLSKNFDYSEVSEEFILSLLKEISSFFDLKTGEPIYDGFSAL